jgi:hypothetical protein
MNEYKKTTKRAALRTLRWVKPSHGQMESQRVRSGDPRENKGDGVGNPAGICERIQVVEKRGRNQKPEW